VKRRARLRRRTDFQAAIGGRRFHQGPGLVGVAIPTEAGGGRIGVTVSRTIKSSTDRNRARRRLREVARTELFAPGSTLGAVGIGYDVVLIARPRILDMPFAELKAEASQAALRLANTKR
jgi:ribonuclease P protein component